MSRSFGLDAVSALEAFKSTAERFQADDLNEDLARDCATKAWHLCDHTFPALHPASQFTNLPHFQRHVRQNCPELGYLQDICIETKHGKITNYVPRIDETRYHGGDFSKEDFDHNDFDVSRLEITLPSGQIVPFRKLISCALDYWSKFFRDNKII